MNISAAGPSSARRTIHITFANNQFMQPARLLRWTAKQYGLQPTRIYRPADPLVRDLQTHYPEIMAFRRGGGYWLWKPFIIQDALARARDGDMVLYTDAGLVFVGDPGPLIQLTAANPIMLFEQHRYRPMSEWTKRDCFVALGCDQERYWTANQLDAAFQLYRAGPQSRAFIADVCRAIVEPSVLTDAPNVLGKPDFPEFREHRHDQSVLSLIALKNNLPVFPNPTSTASPLRYNKGWLAGQLPACPAGSYGKIFTMHRKHRFRAITWYGGKRLGYRAVRFRLKRKLTEHT